MKRSKLKAFNCNEEKYDCYGCAMEEHLAYDKDEADKVMDAMEARIKELEQTHNLEECPLRNENRELKKRLEELEASQPKWISVKDRMPMNHEGVLVLSGQYVTQCVFEDGQWFDSFGCIIQYTSVTHWMPLPLPPKADK